MSNSIYNKRIYLKHSFIISCSFILHSKSSNHYENVWKNIPFFLLPSKRIIFDVNQKAALPTDIIFNIKKESLYSIVLKILHIMSKKNYYNKISDKWNLFKIMMVI